MRYVRLVICTLSAKVFRRLWQRRQNGIESFQNIAKGVGNIVIFFSKKIDSEKIMWIYSVSVDLKLVIALPYCL